MTTTENTSEFDHSPTPFDEEEENVRTRRSTTIEESDSDEDDDLVCPEELEKLRDEYHRDRKNGDSKFNYAHGLIRSGDMEQCAKGVNLLEQLTRKSNDEKLVKRASEFLAWGYIRSSQFEQAEEIVEILNESDPDNLHVKILNPVLADYQKSFKLVRILGIFAATSLFTAAYLWFKWPKYPAASPTSESGSTPASHSIRDSLARSRSRSTRSRRYTSASDVYSR